MVILVRLGDDCVVVGDESAYISQGGPEPDQFLDGEPESKAVIELEDHEWQFVEPAELSIADVVLPLAIHDTSVESRYISSQLYSLSLLHLRLGSFLLPINFTLLVIIFVFT